MSMHLYDRPVFSKLIFFEKGISAMSNLQVNMTKDPIVKSLVIFALPILFSNIFQQLYNTIDIMIVGNFLGDSSLAAIGASSSIYELLLGFCFGVGNGLSIVVSRYFGQGDKTLLKKSVAGSIIIALILTAILMTASSLGLYPLMRALKTPENLLAESHSYVSTLTTFIGVMFAYNLLARFLRGIGNSFMPLVFLIISSLTNILLDLLFITRFQMGIRGAAVATVIAQGFSVILCLIYIIRKTPILVPERQHFAVGKKLYRELTTQGLSMGFMNAVVSSGTVILQSAINGLGEVYIACHATARKLNSFCLMPVSTIGASMSTFVSQNRGAGNKDRIRKGIRTACIMDVCWGVTAIIILFSFARNLVTLFGSTQDVILDNSTLYLRFTAPFYAVLGILFNMRNSLQALGEKTKPLISSFIECAGKIIFALFIIPVMGYWGVIICEPLIWCFMTAQLVYCYLHVPYLRKENA